MMTRSQKIELMGKTGEKIVANLLQEKGHKVKYSINNFDSEKDFLVDGKTVEVKTEQPYVLADSLSFRKKQLKKCKEVDVLYFVTVPALFRKDYKYNGKIFEVDTKSFSYKEYKTKSGIEMIALPIEQPAIKIVGECSDEEKRELLRYADSDYSR
jgi:hypothetical protein